jgi:hypothetical protein
MNKQLRTADKGRPSNLLVLCRVNRSWQTTRMLRNIQRVSGSDRLIRTIPCSVTVMIKSRTLRWAGLVTRMWEMKNV